MLLIKDHKNLASEWELAEVNVTLRLIRKILMKELTLMYTLSHSETELLLWVTIFLLLRTD